MMINKDSKIYVAGHGGLVGSAIYRSLNAKGYTNLVGRRSKELNLLDQAATADFFKKEKPEYVFFAAAKVGGIQANNRYRADFIYENIQIQNNVIYHAFLNDVRKLLYLGSSCIYPKMSPQPIKEDYLLTSPLEYTNEPYAIAKIAGLKMCESFNIQYGADFLAVMPTNIYGINDNFDLEKSHVLPALIRKMHLGKSLEQGDWKAIRFDLSKNPIEGVDGTAGESEIINIIAKYGINLIPGNSKEKNEVEIKLWGTGRPFREFLIAGDLADACIFIMENISFKDLIPQGTGEIRNTHLNIGMGKDISINDLSKLVKEIVGFEGKISWDTSKPDGTPKKLLDVSTLNSLGWKYKTSLDQGISKVYQHYTGS